MNFKIEELQKYTQGEIEFFFAIAKRIERNQEKKDIILKEVARRRELGTWE